MPTNAYPELLKENQMMVNFIEVFFNFATPSVLHPEHCGLRRVYMFMHNGVEFICMAYAVYEETKDEDVDKRIVMVVMVIAFVIAICVSYLLRLFTSRCKERTTTAVLYAMQLLLTCGYCAVLNPANDYYMDILSYAMRALMYNIQVELGDMAYFDYTYGDAQPNATAESLQAEVTESDEDEEFYDATTH
jgi:hypothetical protein